MGAPQFVEDGVTGAVAAPEAEALADAIDRLFALPESRLREMGAEGRARVAHLSWDTVVDRLTETLQ
jgi:glycosyltransferase involved in cell wall biosynthesis